MNNCVFRRCFSLPAAFIFFPITVILFWNFVSFKEILSFSFVASKKNAAIAAYLNPLKTLETSLLPNLYNALYLLSFF